MKYEPPQIPLPNPHSYLLHPQFVFNLHTHTLPTLLTLFSPQSQLCKHPKLEPSPSIISSTAPWLTSPPDIRLDLANIPKTHNTIPKNSLQILSKAVIRRHGIFMPKIHTAQHSNLCCVSPGGGGDWWGHRIQSKQTNVPSFLLPHGWRNQY